MGSRVDRSLSGRAFALFAAVLAAAGSGSGCFDFGGELLDETVTPTDAGPLADAGIGGVVEVRLTALSFKPKVIEVTVGTTVRWLMEDGGTFHFVVEGAPGNLAPGFESPKMDPGDSFEHTFGTPGEYVYHCSNHTIAMRNAMVIVR